jgi:formylglycine-generating enzyme required for sulfatase activity
VSLLPSILAVVVIAAEAEVPAGMVRVVQGDRRFDVDRTEVTVAAYVACVRAGFCAEPGTGALCNYRRPGREQHPINCVSWRQAVAYCAFVDKRLPTRSEWEAAARGDDGRIHPWGNEPPSCGRAVYFENENRLAAIKEGCGGLAGTQPVGSRPEGASPCGALDLAGNVAEWVANFAPTDLPRAFREFRGGAYDSLAEGLLQPGRARSSRRMASVGFRCAQASDW